MPHSRSFVRGLVAFLVTAFIGLTLAHGKLSEPAIGLRAGADAITIVVSDRKLRDALLRSDSSAAPNQ